jgi:uncharacterized protein (DUF58 family)
MIEADFLKQLDKFNLALKKHSTEIQEGEQKSPQQGQGMIFEDHTRYTPGDDIRKIDWKAYARTGEHYIKRFEEEKSLTVHILVDRSSSMDYGTKKDDKYEFASKLGLAAAYMVNNTNDRFRFSVFSETITDISSARRQANMAGLIDTLNDLRKTPESMVERCMTEYSTRIQNKSLVIVISDFLVEPEEVENGLSGMDATDVILFNTLDASEVEPDMEGDMILRDPESNASLRTYLSEKIKKQYKKELVDHTTKIEDAARKHGADYVQVNTGDDFFEAFMEVWRRMNN